MQGDADFERWAQDHKWKLAATYNVGGKPILGLEMRTSCMLCIAGTRF